MNKSSLPTDEEFLDGFFESPTTAPRLPSDLTEILDTMEKSGNLKLGEIPPGVSPEQYVKDFFTPSKNFRGWKSESLKLEARTILSAEDEYLLKIPLGFLFLNRINGFVAQTPRGNPVIVLDSGISIHAMMLARCVFALITRGCAKPFCNDYPPIAFVHAILCLAKYAVTGDPTYLKCIRVWHCPSLEPYELKIARFSLVTEMFALLHEYGHVACHHLTPNTLSQKCGLLAYTQNHAQEYDADEFAFRRFVAKYSLNSVGFAVAMLFRFVDLIEHMVNGKPTPSDTHPAGRDRLEEIKRRFNLQGLEGRPFTLVESTFDVILRERHKFRVH